MGSASGQRQARRLAVAVVLLGTLIRVAIAPSYGYMGIDGDLHQQKQAAHLAVTRGVHQTYAFNPRNEPAMTGEPWAGNYFATYPPGIHYLRAATALVYRWFAPAEFDLWAPELNLFELQRTDLRQRLAASRGFTVAMKVPGIVADALLTAGIFGIVAAGSSPWTALAAAAAYAFNPGIIFDAAFWGQHDSVWLGLIVLSLHLLHRRRLGAAWAALVLAVLNKPQALGFIPLLLVLGLARFSPIAVLRAGVAAAATFGLVFLPFLVHGTFWDSVVAIYRTTFGGEPWVSCFACNLWWLVTGGHGYQMSDATLLVGPLTPRRLGLLLYLACQGAVILRLLRLRDGSATQTYFGAAVIGMGFFTLCTSIHENHVMAVIPLTLLAITADSRLWFVFAGVSLTFLLNMVLFDPAALQPVRLLLGPRLPLPAHALSVGVAAANVLLFAALAVLFWTRTRDAQPLRSAVSLRATNSSCSPRSERT